MGTAELMRLVLEDAGFGVTVATDQRRLPVGSFDCIVSDLMYVSVYTLEDARDWLLRLQDRYPSVPVVLVTGHSEAERDQGSLGAHSVIKKPFDVDVVVRAVREAVAR